MTRIRFAVLVLVAAAAATMLFKRRSSRSEDQPTAVGPPASVGTPPLDRTVVDTAKGKVTNDPAGQWADDGGSGVGGGQQQH